MKVLSCGLGKAAGDYEAAVVELVWSCHCMLDLPVSELLRCNRWPAVSHTIRMSALSECCRGFENTDADQG